MAKDVADLSGPNQAPAETPTSTSAGVAEQAEDVATRHRWPNPGPGPNLDPNFKGGLRASADWLALARLRPLIRTVLQSIQFPSCGVVTSSEAGSAWAPAHNRASRAADGTSMYFTGQVGKPHVLELRIV